MTLLTSATLLTTYYMSKFWQLTALGDTAHVVSFRPMNDLVVVWLADWDRSSAPSLGFSRSTSSASSSSSFWRLRSYFCSSVMARYELIKFLICFSYMSEINGEKRISFKLTMISFSFSSSSWSIVLWSRTLCCVSLLKVRSVWALSLMCKSRR